MLETYAKTQHYVLSDLLRDPIMSLVRISTLQPRTRHTLLGQHVGVHVGVRAYGSSVLKEPCPAWKNASSFTTLKYQQHLRRSESIHIVCHSLSSDGSFTMGLMIRKPEGSVGSAFPAILVGLFVAFGGVLFGYVHFYNHCNRMLIILSDMTLVPSVVSLE